MEQRAQRSADPHAPPGRGQHPQGECRVRDGPGVVARTQRRLGPQRGERCPPRHGLVVRGVRQEPVAPGAGPLGTAAVHVRPEGGERGGRHLVGEDAAFERLVREQAGVPRVGTAGQRPGERPRGGVPGPLDRGGVDPLAQGPIVDGLAQQPGELGGDQELPALQVHQAQVLAGRQVVDALVDAAQDVPGIPEGLEPAAGDPEVVPGAALRRARRHRAVVEGLQPLCGVFRRRSGVLERDGGLLAQGHPAAAGHVAEDGAARHLVAEPAGREQARRDEFAHGLLDDGDLVARDLGDQARRLVLPRGGDRLRDLPYLGVEAVQRLQDGLRVPGPYGDLGGLAGGRAPVPVRREVAEQGPGDEHVAVGEPQQPGRRVRIEDEAELGLGQCDELLGQQRGERDLPERRTAGQLLGKPVVSVRRAAPVGGHDEDRTLADRRGQPREKRGGGGVRMAQVVDAHEHGAPVRQFDDVRDGLVGLQLPLLGRETGVVRGLGLPARQPAGQAQRAARHEARAVGPEHQHTALRGVFGEGTQKCRLARSDRTGHQGGSSVPRGRVGQNVAEYFPSECIVDGSHQVYPPSLLIGLRPSDLHTAAGPCPARGRSIQPQPWSSPCVPSWTTVVAPVAAIRSTMWSGPALTTRRPARAVQKRAKLAKVRMSKCMSVIGSPKTMSGKHPKSRVQLPGPRGFPRCGRSSQSRGDRISTA